MPKSNVLTSADVKKLILEWDYMSVDDFAYDFDVSKSTVYRWVNQIREMKPDACPKKTVPDMRMIDVIKSVLKDLDDLHK